MIILSEKSRNFGAVFFLLLLTLAAFWLRLINLGKLSFWSDDAFTYSAVEGILKHGWPVLPSGLVYFKQLLYSYLAAFFALILGLNEFGLRFPSALAGTLVIPLTYLLARDTFKSRLVGLLAAIFMAFNYWSFEFSREARYYTTFQFFYLLSLILFYRGFIKEEKKYQKWAVVSFAASVFVFRLALLLILNFFILVFIKGFKKVFTKKTLAAFLLIAVLFGGNLVFEVFFWKVGRHIKHAAGLSAIAKDIFAANASFFRQFQWLFKRTYFLAILGFIAYAIQLGINAFKNARGKDFWLKTIPAGWSFVLLNFALPLFLMGFGKAHYQPRYVFYLLPLFAILYGWAAFWFGGFLAKIILAPFKTIKNDQKIFPVLQILFFAGLVLIFTKNVNLRHLLTITRRLEGDPVDARFTPSTAAVFHNDHKTTGQFVRKHLKNNDLVIAIYAIYQHIYTGRVDYWLWTMSEEGWPAFYEKEGRLVDTYSGAEMIRDLKKLKKVIRENKNRRIWLISTPSLENAGHISPKIKNFLKVENAGKIVFTSHDQLSQVWLWPQGQKSL